MLGNKKNVVEMPADAAAAAGGGAEAYGGFWIRFLAYLVDGVILFIALVLLAVLAAFLGEIGAMVYGFLCLFGPFLYFAVMQSSARQASFGKQLVGLKVAHAATGERLSFLRSLVRELAKILSSLILGIGFIMAAFTGRRQALHDMLAATVVVRDSAGNVLIAIIVLVVALVLPFFVLPLIMGLLVGVLGFGIFGALMGDAMKQPKKEPAPKPSISQPATKQPEKPKPPVSAAPAAQSLGEADYDKLLARPLTGIEAPSTARAGPAVLQLGTHFAGSEPTIWVKVMLPQIPNLELGGAVVTVDRVADAKGQDRYNRGSSFEGEFFRKLTLSEERSGVQRLEGTRSVRLTPGTGENDVQSIEGKLALSLPLGLARASFGAGDAGKERDVGPLKMTLKSLSGQEVAFSIAGQSANFLGVKGYDDKGAVIDRESSMRSGESYKVKFRSAVSRVEATATSGMLNREYPFKLARGATAPVVAASAPAMPAKPAAEPAKAAAPPPAPAKPAVVEVKPEPAKSAAPPPAPAKPAAVETKPEPAKPAAVAPAPAKPAAPEKPAAVAAAPTPPPAPVMKSEPAPRPAPAAAPMADEKPKAARRAAKRKPAAPAAVESAPAPVARTAKYNDVMTAVVLGDRAAVTELVEMGFWVDRPASSGMTALMVAALRGDAAMTQVLLKNGADPNRRGPEGGVLDYARRGGNSKVVALIQQAGGR